MQCPSCSTMNDNDALFCSECGHPCGGGQQASSVKSRRSYLFMLVLLPVITIVAAIGYYKYVLPEGVAAVVNGEEITLLELDAAGQGQGGSSADSGGNRYRILKRLITERIALQEARKAGIAVSRQELASAVGAFRAETGLDETAFESRIKVQYGNTHAFEDAVERRLLLSKLVSEKIIPSGAGPQASREAMDRWLSGMSEKAEVRIALAEQGTGAGCGGCAKKPEAATGGAGRGCGGCATGCGQARPGQGQGSSATKKPE